MKDGDRVVRAGGEREGDCVDSQPCPEPRGIWFGRRPRGMSQMAGAFVWLAFIVFPAVNAVARHGTALDHTLTIAGAAAFVAIYIALVLSWRRRYADRALLVLFAFLVAISCALTLSDGASWGFLFTYCAASAGLITRRFGFAGVIACSALAGVTSAIGGANGGQVIGWVASSAGIGMLIMVLRDLRIRNEELSEARAELARMAVAEERERFARDLHDLLGHSLSVIALKAELAGRILPDHPAGAAKEVADLELVARTALGEVREAVSGYRQPTLEGELAGARMALSAAGIKAHLQQVRVTLDPAVEAVLAWAVREGATNVIRHSGARHCRLKINATLTDASVEVIDDGVGGSAGGNVAGNGGEPNRAAIRTAAGASYAGNAGATDLARGGGPARRAAPGNGHPIGGHGLAGLAERARLVNGTIEAGALAHGGYRLAVTVPVSHA
jgi:two-component system, NarL family, sensor histidine kinase DesK